MVDSWTTLSSTLRATHSRPSLSTHTTPEDPSSDARLSHLLPSQVPSPHSLMSPPTAQLNSRLPSIRDQSPLPLRPTNPSSRCTPVESSPHPHAERNSTTVSSLSDMVRDTSSSRTPGVPHGETRDTSRSLTHPPTSAESSPSHPTHMLENFEFLT